MVIDFRGHGTQFTGKRSDMDSGVLIVGATDTVPMRAKQLTGRGVSCYLRKPGLGSAAGP
jgi:hypothetical protein